MNNQLKKFLILPTLLLANAYVLTNHTEHPNFDNNTSYKEIISSESTLEKVKKVNDKNININSFLLLAFLILSISFLGYSFFKSNKKIHNLIIKKVFLIVKKQNLLFEKIKSYKKISHSIYEKLYSYSF